MKTLNRSDLGVGGIGDQVVISMGTVKNNADPAQHGRLQIFIPSVDNKDFEVDELPWASYVSPFGGTTVDALVGREQSIIPGVSAYGMWAVPQVGAQVIVGFLEGDQDTRFWMGCLFMPELNRTLPQSLNDIKTEIDESGQYPQQEIPHYRKNLGEASLAPEDMHYKTRGGWARSVSHPSNKNKNKPRDDGYWTKPNEPEKADSQIFSWTTPGRHHFAMSDVDEECRIRLKTTEGTQIILDDTNERIYISTAKGRNWIEVDEGSGKIYFYTASKFSLHSENDINLYSKENINIVAKKRVNIRSEERAVKIQGKMNIEMLSEEANIKISASRDMHIKTFDGPKAPKVEELLKCTLPPYAGDPLGLIRDWEEEEGSETSKVFIDGVQDVNIRSDEESILVTAKHGVDVKAMENSIILQATEDIELKADREMKMNSTNTMDIRSSSEQVKITGKDGVDITGKTIAMKADTSIAFEAPSLGFISPTLTIAAGGGSLDLTGANITIDAAGSLNLKAPIMQTNIIGTTGLKVLPAVPVVSLNDFGGSGNPGPGSSGAEDADPVDNNADIAPEADQVELEDIKPNMIVPEHDSADGWVRDDDEGLCKTPRNKKYQG